MQPYCRNAHQHQTRHLATNQHPTTQIVTTENHYNPDIPDEKQLKHDKMVKPLFKHSGTDTLKQSRPLKKELPLRNHDLHEGMCLETTGLKSDPEGSGHSGCALQDALGNPRE